jgi:hypothetical protein
VVFLGLPVIRQAPFTVQPGDSFVTKFWFNSENGTKFGRASYEEMNKAVFLYYPAKTILPAIAIPWACVYDIPFAACNATMSSRILLSSEGVERVFGKAPAMCNAKATIDENTATTSTGTNHFPAFSYRYVGCCITLIVLWFW